MRPRRGEIYWTEFDPVVGCEMGKTRPAVVVQNDEGNRNSPTTIVVTVTSRLLGLRYPFIVEVPEGLLPKPSVVNCAHIRTVDTARVRPGRIATLDEATMDRVDDALAASLGLGR
ncbi:MAG: type II toxin-antitoxin system PemK/MazF family toxin [Coriobacteriia bacterium]|nr:type II toxin-antitoxin system PemK/MazF family toxin [Coriobacteriia bacterium]